MDTIRPKISSLMVMIWWVIKMEMNTASSATSSAFAYRLAIGNEVKVARRVERPDDVHQQECAQCPVEEANQTDA